MQLINKRIIVIALTVLAVGCAGAFAFDRYTLATTYARVPDKQVNLLPSYNLYEEDYLRTDESFELDGYTLRGHVYGPNNTRGLVVFRHGIFSKHSDYLALITALVDKGWKVFAYDAIGCGESDGDSTLGMSQSPIDVTAAVRYAQESGMAGDAPLALWGHSWGGYGVAAALESCQGVGACVTMSGYDTPMKVLDYSAVSAFGPLGKIQYPFIWLNTFIDFGDSAEVSAANAILASGVPTLVIHGLGDTVVPYEGTSILGELSQRPQDLVEKNVETLFEDEVGRDGHNSYFYSPESQAYLEDCSSKLQTMLDEYGNDFEAPEIQKFLASVDLRRANTADRALIDAIDSFLGDALGK